MDSPTRPTALRPSVMPTKAVLHHPRRNARTNHERPCAAHRKGKKAHYLLAGDTHLVIVEKNKSVRYRPTAAAEILDLAQADLDALRRQLEI
jgi:hypothetical protein